MVSIDGELLKTIFDLATGMDFGSGFLDKEEVDSLRAVAVILGIDPLLATPANVLCQYQPHQWRNVSWDNYPNIKSYCPHCNANRPEPA
jgi:hypothetical protein